MYRVPKNSFEIQLLIFPQPPSCQGEFRFLVFLPLWFFFWTVPGSLTQVDATPCFLVNTLPIHTKKISPQRAQRTQR